MANLTHTSDSFQEGLQPQILLPRSKGGKKSFASRLANQLDKITGGCRLWLIY